MLKRTGWVYGEYPPGIAQLFLDGLYSCENNQQIGIHRDLYW